MKLIRSLMLLLPVILLAGCMARYTPNIYNVKNAPIVVKQNTQASLSQVTQAIMIAGTGLGWDMNTIRPGYITAKLNIRDHFAKVSIKYNTRRYSIHYINSDLMKDGNIHKNYNGWVQNLDRTIKTQILKI